ncbi:MAG: CBS domain-containing protein, partial [bacterium]
MSDYLDDELQIMDERYHEDKKVISTALCKLPIKELNIPKAITIDQESSIQQAIDLMIEKNIGSVIITNNEKLSGIFTERDLLNKVIKNIDTMKNTPVKDVMTPNPVSLQIE